MAGVAGALPLICSGAMYAGVPMRVSVPVSGVASAARAMPKSMTAGPSGVSRMLAGLRSRCTMPAAWMSPRASATPAISSRDVLGRSGPPTARARASEGPGTYSVASHGSGPSVLLSTTGTM